MIIKDLEYKIAKLGVISGLFGYALSFYSFYLFHIAVIFFLIYVFFVSGSFNLRTIKVALPIILFFLFSAFTLIWTKSLELGLKNLFYIFCGLITVLFSIQCSKDQNKLQDFYKIIVIVGTLNFLIGFCESLGLFRLPMSPFSPYASFFGYKVSNLNDFYAYQVQGLLNKPTGFNGNPNTFGFVFIILFPFLFFYNKYLKYVSLFFLIFFNFYLQSRGVFIATLIFFLVYFLINFKEKFIYFILLVIFITALIPFLSYDFSDLRISSSFDSVNIGFDNILNNNIDLYSNSTDVRSSIYSLGIINLLNSPLIGLGLGGIQSVLINMNSPIQSFHFYFLEVLVDYGVVFYMVFIWFYISLTKKLFRAAKRVDSKKYKRIFTSVFYALIIMPIASIAPSSIVYNLTAWIVIGLALSIVYLEKEGKLYE